MKATTLDKLIWPAIFAGIVFAGFGLSLPDDAGVLSWAVTLFGAVLVLAGLVMIALRSRFDD